MLWTCLGTVCLLASACLLSAQPASTPIELPEGATTIFDSDRTPLRLDGRDSAGATLTTIDAVEGRFERGWRVKVPSAAGAPYFIQLTTKLPAPVQRGETIMLLAWMRTIETPDETAEGRIGVVVEQAGEKHDKEISAELSAGANWRQIYIPVRVRHDHAATGTQIAIRLGARQQTVEIGGVRLLSYGGDFDPIRLPRSGISYIGRDLDAPWRAKANERIAQHRMSDLRVRVVDAAGNPVANADVAVRMTRHAFPFGGVYNPARITGSRHDQPVSETYRQVFVRLFNMAVDEWAMKWPAWEKPEDRQIAMSSLEWVRAQGIPVRGHALVWPSWRRSPASARALENDPEALRAAVARRVTEAASDYRGKVVDWDVVNEPYTHYDILEILGRDVMADWFKLARAADPDAVLYLNEAGVPNSPPSHERYDILVKDVKRLQELGAPIGGIGLQGHFGRTLNSPEDLLGIYDKVAATGLPIRITEFDVDVPDDTRLQADYYRDFLIATFSHPSINGVLQWGFWSQQHWKPAAALYDKDWNITPVGQVYLDLVFNQWWTNERRAADPSGVASFRGFHGDYEIVVTQAGKETRSTATLPAEGATIEIKLD